MRLIYDKDGIMLFHGDFRDAVFDQVDAVITDPPYEQTSLEWDRWVDGWPGLMPSNSLWCFGSLRMFTAHWSDFADWKFSQDIIWEKHNGSGFHADRFKRVHEQVAHFYRGDWAVVGHEVPTTADAVRKTVRRKERPPHMGEIPNSTYRSTDGGPAFDAFRAAGPLRTRPRVAPDPEAAGDHYPAGNGTNLRNGSRNV